MTRLNRFSFALLLCFNFCLVKSQNPSAAKFYDIEDSSKIGYWRIYVGEVDGISKIKFDSIKIASNRTDELPLLTKSNNSIEVRVFEWVPFPSGIARCFILYYDSSFKLKQFNYSFNTKKYIEIPITRKLNVDSLYDKLIENAIFSLPQYNTYFDTMHFVKTISQKGWGSYEFKKIGFSDGAWYELEYKVRDTYNTIQMSWPFLHLQEYPDNQIFRRYQGILAPFLSIHK